MQPKSINPYSPASAKQKEALDFIITNLPSSPTFEQLNEVLLTAMFGSDPDGLLSGDVAPVFLQSALPLVYNGYVNQLTIGNGQLTSNSQLPIDNKQMTTGGQPLSTVNCLLSIYNTQYTESQIIIITNLLQGIKRVPVESIPDFLSGVEEEIARSGLSYQEQLPLYIAVVCGRSAQEYWLTQIANPTLWAAYLNADAAIKCMWRDGYRLLFREPCWVMASSSPPKPSFPISFPPYWAL
jgi:hypothetical protein